MGHPHFHLTNSSRREAEARRLARQGHVLQGALVVLLLAWPAGLFRPSLLLIVALSAVAAGRYAESRRLRRENAVAGIAQQQSRPWVLVLRSFSDDNLKLGSVPGSFMSLVETELSAIGLTAALVNPGTGPSGDGPLPLSVNLTAKWEDAVAGAMRDAARVLVVLGTGNGLRWELDCVLAQGILRKCIFLMPPVSRREAAGRWEGFSNWLETGGLKPPDDILQTPPLALTTQDGRNWSRHPAQRVRGKWRQPLSVDYSVALREIVRGGPVDVNGIDASQNWILSVLLWGVGLVILLVFLVVGYWA